MASEKHIALVSQLLRQTHDGKLEWEESALSGAFEVAFANYSIRMYQDNADYWLGILDKTGRLIESFSDVDVRDAEWEAGNSYAAFQKLYTMARRVALGAEKALNELLEELDKNDIPF